MKLYQIEYLLAVCQYGSFSKAADELMVSRPAVSRAMKELEDELGTEIFRRRTTGVELTDAGQVVFNKYSKIDKLLKELRAEVDVLKSSSAGGRQLNIGISFTARCTCLPMITAFRHAYPDVRLSLTDLTDSFVDNGSLCPDYDMEIALSENREYDGIDYCKIGESKMTFCCSRSHPLANRTHVSIYEIKDEQLGGLYHLEQSENQMSALFARFGLEPNIAYITQQVSFLRQMIRVNLCSSVKPQESMEDDPDIVTIPIDEVEPLQLRVLWSNRIRHNSALYDFVQFAREFPTAP